MMLPKCCTFAFGPHFFPCRGSINGGASSVVLAAHASFASLFRLTPTRKGGRTCSTLFLQCHGRRPSIQRSGYWHSARPTEAVLGGFILPEEGRTCSPKKIRGRRCARPTNTRQRHSGLRSSIFGSTTNSEAIVDGEEPRQEEGLCSEQDRLLGVLEEEPPPAEDNETRAESHEGEGHWDELDESELERLGIQIHVMDGENIQDFHEQLTRAWGTVNVENQQDEYEVDAAALQATLRRAMEVLGCQAWDVGVVLTTDEEVQRLNSQYRGVEASTDILSFPVADMSDEPGVLPEVRIPAEMDLGDMFVSLAYVDRQMVRDRKEATGSEKGEEPHVEEDGAEWWDSRRGVSGAMSKNFDLQDRASMLLIHGLIHLLGYDHETPEDHEAMVRVEEAVLVAVWGDKETHQV
ncbi:unnamed protein product [Ascophyllum nodosum]